jgi:hypothetical protein
MNFELTYELDFKRVMSAVINDSRNTIPSISGKDGNAIQAYVQTQTSLVVPGVLVYRIVGDNGVLGGYCGLQVQNGVANLLFMQLRPAFQQFLYLISPIIRNFISNNQFNADYLA